MSKPSVQSERDQHSSYTAPDPRFAAGLANAFVRAYIDTSLNCASIPAKRYSTANSDQTGQKARDSLEKAQARSAFRRRRASPRQTSGDVWRLPALVNSRRSWSRFRPLLQNQTAGRGAGQWDLSGTDARGLEQSVINNLKAQLSSQEARPKGTWCPIWQCSSSQVIELKESIAELGEDRRNQARHRWRGRDRLDQSGPVRAQVQAALAGAACQGAEPWRTRRGHGAGRRSGQCPAHLLSNTDGAHPDEHRARLLKVMLTSARAVAPVDHPHLASSLEKYLLSVFLGLLALGATFLLELFDRRVRSVDDVAAVLRSCQCSESCPSQGPNFAPQPICTGRACSSASWRRCPNRLRGRDGEVSRFDTDAAAVLEAAQLTTSQRPRCTYGRGGP